MHSTAANCSAEDKENFKTKNNCFQILLPNISFLKALKLSENWFFANQKSNETFELWLPPKASPPFIGTLSSSSSQTACFWNAKKVLPREQRHCPITGGLAEITPPLTWPRERGILARDFFIKARSLSLSFLRCNRLHPNKSATVAKNALQHLSIARSAEAPSSLVPPKAEAASEAIVSQCLPPLPGDAISSAGHRPRLPEDKTSWEHDHWPEWSTRSRGAIWAERSLQGVV